MAARPRQHRPRRTLPFSDPERTNALWLVRWSDCPDDPLRIVVDHTLLDLLGLRPGDRIAFEPIALDRRTLEGGLIVRPATPGEPAIELTKTHYERHQHPYTHLFAVGPDGPDIQWTCPPEWIDIFFPLEYIPGPGAPIFANPDRKWLLGDLLDQREPVAVSLGCSLLEFRLQRTDPIVPTLDLHLPAGVLNLMDWSPATSLALISQSGFDPSAPADTLTIRQTSPGESNISWDGAKFNCRPDPTWLDRYFPGLHDNTEEIPLYGPAPTSTEWERDPGDADFLDFPGEPAPDWEFSSADGERDTFCVHFSSFRLGPKSLSFAIPERSNPFD